MSQHIKRAADENGLSISGVLAKLQDAAAVEQREAGGAMRRADPTAPSMQDSRRT
jgi:hypothetical protein